MVFLLVAKFTGLFALCGYFCRRQLGIICYHGFALDDEHLFRPKLFMRPTTVRQRLEWLRHHGYTFLPLESALIALGKGSLPDRTIVVTIDDGWYGTWHFWNEVFHGLDSPVTLYVTTYYVDVQDPVFGLAVQYMFWRTRLVSISLEGIVPGESGTIATRGAEAALAMARLIDYGDGTLSASGRRELAQALGVRLGVDFGELVRSRRFSLMSRDQIRDLAARNVDVQLHTHRHVLPVAAISAANELECNRAVLEPLVGKSCHHLCYPSGEWTQSHWLALKAAGIQSATTCDPGLNSVKTPMYALRRILDAEGLSLIEFEAELVGFKDVIRKLVGAIRGFKSNSRVSPL